jgi:adenylyltransferase/sulfurtransferase
MQQEERYHRQEILPGFGKEGQQRLAEAKVLVVGAGGLGCPVLQYLTAAGVGQIGVVDGDVVSLSNLHRQVLYGMEDIGKEKATVAVAKLQLMNPDVQFEKSVIRINPANAIDWVSGYDIVVDCTDNFPTRYLLNDASVLAEKPLVYGAVSTFEGQVAVFNVDGSGQYRDLFPVMPMQHEVKNCAEAGVLGVLPGVIGTMMATETIKWITGIGSLLVNQLLTYNALSNQFFTLSYQPGNNNNGPKTFEALQQVRYDFSCGLPTLRDWMKDEQVIIVDVREPDEQPAVEGFKHRKIPLGVLTEKVSELQGYTVVLFCKTGVRSERGAVALRALGVDAYHVMADVQELLSIKND